MSFAKIGKFIFALFILSAILLFQNCGRIENSPIEDTASTIESQSVVLTEAMQERLDQILKINTDNNNDGYDDSLLLLQENLESKFKASLLLSDRASGAFMIEFTGFNGTILSLYANSPLNEEIRLEFRSGTLILSKYLSDKVFSQVKLPASIVGTHFVGFRAGVEFDELEIVLDGKTLIADLEVTGSPVDFSYLSKTMVVSNRVLSAYVFNRDLSTLDLALLNKLQASQNNLALNLDSNLSDQLKRAATRDPALPTDYFTPASLILKNKCQSCHTWAAASETDFLNSGRVVKSSLEQSPVYFRLTNSTVVPSTPQTKQNMPLNSSALTSSEIKTIADWITNIK